MNVTHALWLILVSYSLIYNYFQLQRYRILKCVTILKNIDFFNT